MKALLDETRNTPDKSSDLLRNPLFKMKSENMLKKDCLKHGLPYLSPLPCATPSEDQERIALLRKRIANERGKIVFAAKLNDRLNKKRLVRQITRHMVVPASYQAQFDLQQKVTTAESIIIDGPTTQPHSTTAEMGEATNPTGPEEKYLSRRHPFMAIVHNQPSPTTLLGSLISSQLASSDLICASLPPINIIPPTTRAAPSKISHGAPPLKKRLKSIHHSLLLQRLNTDVTK
jgi:hypothetical protein